jgi:hypothetical protein
MDCIHARLLIVLQGRDAHELDADARAALDTHLEQCAGCLAWASQESRVDEALRQAMAKVPVPAALPSKILHALEHQRRPRRAAWLSAAAAVLLLGLAMGGYVWYSAKPALTYTDFANEVTFRELSSPETVKEWFAEMGLAMDVPEKLNFENCNDYLIAKINGHRLPRLQYMVRGEGDGPPAIAHVYVVDRSRFQVDDIVHGLEQHDEPLVTSNHKIQALPLDSHTQFIFVVVYTGSNLQPFFGRAVAYQ